MADGTAMPAEVAVHPKEHAMYSSLLSPGERDADHPARGSLFPAFAAEAALAHQHRHRLVLAASVLLMAAVVALLALR